MKSITLLLLSSLLANSIHAEEPPPPPNPFANLPANSDRPFNPFEDEFDDGGEEFTPPPLGNATNGRGATNGGTATGRPVNPAAGRTSGAGAGGVTISNPNSGPVSSSPGTSKMEPANCKDVVENFDYPDAEILDVAKAIAKITGKNLIYNPQDIKGRISIVSQTPITVCDAWNAFLTSLNMKGFALVPSGKYLRVERIANAKEKQTEIYTHGRKTPNNDEFITRVIPLRYIDATEFESAFRLWMPREARMQAYAQTNTIIITDTSAHINRMVELINLLDVAGYQESLVVIPIRNALAKDIARLIEQILNDSRGSGGQFGSPQRPTNTYPGAPSRTAGRGRSGGSTISKIIADDRSNSLIVKANAAGVAEIRSLIRRLDTKVAVSEGSGRIHVVQLRYADAETMAKTLTGTVGQSGGQRAGNRAFPSFGDQQQVFQGDIKVSPDKTTQSLVITASPADFQTIKKVVEALDVPRDQVYIEALILDVSLNRDSAYGTSFVSASNGIGLPSASDSLKSALLGLPSQAGFVLGFKSGGQKADVEFGGQKYKVNSLNGVLELIQGNSDANVVARPQIFVLDNEKATFEVSKTVPVERSTFANGQTNTSFENDKAQLLLEVTPQINKGSDFVKLDINQKLENFDSTDVPAQIQGRATGKNTRATQTKILVQSDDTVVLSGMMRDDQEEITKKVPLLGDIPLLGWLFKNTKTVARKSNLIVFITPRVIKQYDKVRSVLNRRLEEREEFVREQLGSRDPMGRYFEKMKKELPDLTVIEPLPRNKAPESQSFSAPSAPERDYEEDYYYDPSWNLPPEGPIPLPPPDNFPQPEIFPPDGTGAPVVIPEGSMNQ